MAKNFQSKRPYGFGNTNRRFTKSPRKIAGDIARDRFAFDQLMSGNDCAKICKGGDFVVQERDFFGNEIGKPKNYQIKTGNSKITANEEEHKRKLGRDRYKIVRY
ncbi:MAG: hypothetical protein FWC33_01425 [Candidatus Bathyarchaeota archaeon]|nr:hypothetical protein [Candidatus Termiticorpusculum sp.]